MSFVNTPSKDFSKYFYPRFWPPDAKEATAAELKGSGRPLRVDLRQGWGICPYGGKGVLIKLL